MIFSGVSFKNTIMHGLNHNDSLSMQEVKMIVLNKLEKWAQVKTLEPITNLLSETDGAAERVSLCGTTLVLVFIGYFLDKWTLL